MRDKESIKIKTRFLKIYIQIKRRESQEILGLLFLFYFFGMKKVLQTKTKQKYTLNNNNNRFFKKI